MPERGSIFRRDASAPPFSAPWQAQAFALTLALHEKGLFTWPEWTEALSAEIRARGSDPSDDGSRYYDHWLAALEGLVTAKQAATPERLGALRAAWDRSARATPHGQEIRIENDPLRDAG